MPNDRDRPQDETQTEREGMDLLGRSSIRDDAIPGVSDASARRDQSVDAAPASPRREKAERADRADTDPDA